MITLTLRAPDVHLLQVRLYVASIISTTCSTSLQQLHVAQEHSSMNTSVKSSTVPVRKLRILCFHGYQQNAKVRHCVWTCQQNLVLQRFV